MASRSPAGTICTASAGRPASARPSREHRSERRVRMRAASEPPRKRTALPLLMHKRGGVDGDVGARLVDHGDDAERNAHLADEQAIGAAGHPGDGPDRIFQARDVFDRSSHCLDSRLGQCEPVDERCGGRSTLAEARDVGAIGLEDCRDALSEPPCDGEERVVLFRRDRLGRDRATAVTRPLGEPSNALLDIDRAHGPTLALLRARIPRGVAHAALTGAGGVGLGRAARIRAGDPPPCGAAAPLQEAETSAMPAPKPRSESRHPALVHGLHGLFERARGHVAERVTRALVVDHADVADVIELGRREDRQPKRPEALQHASCRASAGRAGSAARGS